MTGPYTVKRSTRTIEVWENTMLHVEREGQTISMQSRVGGQHQAMVLPVDQASLLRDLLNDATAIPGIVLATEPLS